MVMKKLTLILMHITYDLIFVIIFLIMMSNLFSKNLNKWKNFFPELIRELKLV